MLNDYISRVELEEFPICHGYRCTVYGKLGSEEVRLGELLIEKNVDLGTELISGAMLVAEIALGLRKEGKTLKFRSMKALSDRHPSAKLNPAESQNLLAILLAPGKRFFVADSYEEDELVEV